MKGALRVVILTGVFLLGLLGAPPSKALTPYFPVLEVSGIIFSWSPL